MLAGIEFLSLSITVFIPSVASLLLKAYFIDFKFIIGIITFYYFLFFFIGIIVKYCFNTRVNDLKNEKVPSNLYINMSFHLITLSDHL